MTAESFLYFAVCVTGTTQFLGLTFIFNEMAPEQFRLSRQVEQLIKSAHKREHAAGTCCSDSLARKCF